MLRKERVVPPRNSVDLIRRAQGGNDGAMEVLLEQNTPLISRIACFYRFRGGLPFEDMIQEGKLGLMTAIQRFDPQQGNQLSTYATPWIHCYMQNACYQTGNAIRLPAWVHEVISRIHRLQEHLSMTEGREPTIEEVVKASKVSRNQAESCMGVPRVTCSLDSYLPESDETWVEFMEDLVGGDTEAEVLEGLFSEEVCDAVSQLKEDWRDVLIMRFGLDGRGTHTLEEVGRRLHVTRETVRVREKHALAELKEQLCSNPWMEQYAGVTA